MDKKKIFIGIAIFLAIGFGYTTFANPAETEKLDGDTSEVENYNSTNKVENNRISNSNALELANENNEVEENKEEENTEVNPAPVNPNPVVEEVIPVIQIEEESVTISYGEDYDVMKGVSVNTNDRVVPSVNNKEVKELSVGTHKVTYTVTRNGVNYIKTRELEVVDTESPLMTIVGDKTVTLNVGKDSYNELGVTVTDNYDTDLEYYIDTINYSVNGKFVKSVKEVDTSVTGLYKVVYKVKDSSNNEGYDANDLRHNYVMRLVYVVDKESPKIMISDGFIGDKDKLVFKKVSFKLYDNYSVDKVIVNGNEKDLTNNKWSDHNNVEVGKGYGVKGKNKITVVDVSGNETTLEFYLDTEAPVINLPSTLGRNKNEMHVERASFVSIDSVKALVTDDFDDDIEIYPYKADLLVSSVASENTYNYDYKTNGFDTSKTGRYNLYYKVKDSVGNEVAITMLLVIKDTTKPTVSASYSTLELTNNNILVTLNSNEKLDMSLLEGFKEEGTVYTKEYEENTTETLTIKDLYGNTSESINVSINNIDKVAPVLEEVEDEKVVRYGFIKKDNITVTDNVDENVTIEKVITFTEPYKVDSTVVNSVDTTKIGTYNVTYIATDKAGNTSSVSKKIIVDQLFNSSLDIYFDAPVTLYVKKGSSVPTIDYDVYDLFDNQLANKTSIKDNSYVDTSNINTSRRGIYTATIYATDWAGNTSSRKVIVTVY